MLVVIRDKSYGGKAYFIFCYWVYSSVGWCKRQSAGLKILSSNMLKAWQFNILFLHYLFISMWYRCLFVPLAWLDVYYLGFFESSWLGIQEFFFIISKEDPISFRGRLIFKFVYATETHPSNYIPTSNQKGTVRD